jgi:hypothetical protein
VDVSITFLGSLANSAHASPGLNIDVTWGFRRVHTLAALCSEVVRLAGLPGPAIFKTGIASDPHHRFFNREFGYLHERVWHFMDVVWRAPANECRDMEIALIAQTREIPGCRNIKPGGDGVRPDREYECFVYFVLAGAGDGNLYRACDERRVRPRLL